MQNGYGTLFPPSTCPLVADGQYDTFYCLVTCTNAYLKAGAADYTGAPCYNYFALPNSGHDVNLQLDLTEWFRRANAWGPEQGSVNPQPVTYACS